MSRQAILFVAYGTTHPDAANAYIHARETLEKRCPEIPIFDAYTSARVRETLRAQSIWINSPAEAVKAIEQQGFCEVYVQSLHVVAGEEFHRMVRDIRAAGTALKVQFSPPLMRSAHDIRTIADFLALHPPLERRPDDIWLLMAHGHPEGRCDSVYMALAAELTQRDRRIFLSTLYTLFPIKEQIQNLLTADTRRIFLSPLMGVAGKHAADMLAGSGPESWRTQLIDAGFSVFPQMTGLIDTPLILDYFLRECESFL